MLTARETFEFGFRQGFYVRDLGKVTRSSSDEEFRNAMNEAWDRHCGTKPESTLETDIKTAVEMDRKGITGPKSRKKSAKAGGK